MHPFLASIKYHLDHPRFLEAVPPPTDYRPSGWYSGHMDQTVAHKITKFFAQYPEHHYTKGEILLHAHDDPSRICHLIDGRVKQYDISFRGDEIVLNVFKPPAFFPVSFAINRTPNPYFYEAETDIEGRFAPLDDVVVFLRANPDVLYDLLARVYRGTDGLLGRLAHLMGGSARSRVLYELLIEGRRFGQPDASGRVVLQLTESDIGARAGLARETVSREIHKLKAEGLIAVVKQHIHITSLERLTSSVGPDL